MDGRVGVSDPRDDSGEVVGEMGSGHSDACDVRFVVMRFVRAVRHESEGEHPHVVERGDARLRKDAHAHNVRTHPVQDILVVFAALELRSADHCIRTAPDDKTLPALFFCKLNQSAVEAVFRRAEFPAPQRHVRREERDESVDCSDVTDMEGLGETVVIEVIGETPDRTGRDQDVHSETVEHLDLQPRHSRDVGVIRRFVEMDAPAQDNDVVIGDGCNLNPLRVTLNAGQLRQVLEAWDLLQWLVMEWFEGDRIAPAGAEDESDSRLVWMPDEEFERRVSEDVGSVEFLCGRECGCPAIITSGHDFFSV